MRIFHRKRSSCEVVKVEEDWEEDEEENEMDLYEGKKMRKS